MSTSKVWYVLEIRFEDGDWFTTPTDNRFWSVDDAKKAAEQFDRYETRVVRVVETREVVS